MRFADLVGTWTLHRIEITGATGVRILDQPSASGMLRYTADGQVWVILHVPDHQPDGLLSGAYTGTVTVEADTVIHHVSVGTTPFGAGSVLARNADLSADRTELCLSAPAAGVTARLRWQRTA
ncbi:lipocalin-like domain-containing protein [Nocardia sp. NBC_01499]|uniref:hypothetical protein n=1 Tax=Nocardia sp. NBC_01499 TaxID=2903597 RepID=UPI00386538A0